MRIDPKALEAMFRHAGVDKDALHQALREMGKAALKPKLRNGWSPENPTRNFCYVVSEMVYWYVAPKGTQPFSLNVADEPVKHFFLKWPDGTIVDLTADQFADYGVIDYGNVKKATFSQRRGRGPSSRARQLAQLMGYGPDSWPCKPA